MKRGAVEEALAHRDALAAQGTDVSQIDRARVSLAQRLLDGQRESIVEQSNARWSGRAWLNTLLALDTVAIVICLVRFVIEPSAILLAALLLFFLLALVMSLALVRLRIEPGMADMIRAFSRQPMDPQ